MSISGISGTSDLDYQLEIQLQKEKEKKAAEQVNVAEQAQTAAIGNTADTSIETQYASAAIPKDTIEISAEGRAYQQKMQAATDEGAALTQATSSESETSSTQNLTSLTEDEIQDLVDKGTISQAEANAELMRRQAEKAQTEQTPKEDNEPYMEEES
jgi:hypothetical protein